MANHDILLRNGFQVCSYGIGTCVKLPSRDKKGRTYAFGTPYVQILQELMADDEQFHTNTGVIPMCNRNKAIKRAPEDFRNLKDDELRSISVIVCSEYDIFERVVESKWGNALFLRC